MAGYYPQTSHARSFLYLQNAAPAQAASKELSSYAQSQSYAAELQVWQGQGLTSEWWRSVMPGTHLIAAACRKIYF